MTTKKESARGGEKGTKLPVINFTGKEFKCSKVTLFQERLIFYGLKIF